MLIEFFNWESWALILLVCKWKYSFSQNFVEVLVFGIMIGAKNTWSPSRSLFVIQSVHALARSLSPSLFLPSLSLSFFIYLHILFILLRTELTPTITYLLIIVIKRSNQIPETFPFLVAKQPLQITLSVRPSVCPTWHLLPIATLFLRRFCLVLIVW